jgi:hypothetical protein
MTAKIIKRPVNLNFGLRNAAPHGSLITKLAVGFTQAQRDWLVREAERPDCSAGQVVRSCVQDAISDALPGKAR